MRPHECLTRHSRNGFTEHKRCTNCCYYWNHRVSDYGFEQYNRFSRYAYDLTTRCYRYSIDYEKYIYTLLFISIFIVHGWYQGEQQSTQVDTGIINVDRNTNSFIDQTQSYTSQLPEQLIRNMSSTWKRKCKIFVIR